MSLVPFKLRMCRELKNLAFVGKTLMVAMEMYVKICLMQINVMLSGS